MTEPEFDFHRLEVYQRAMELKPLIDAIIGQLPPGNGDLERPDAAARAIDPL